MNKFVVAIIVVSFLGSVCTAQNWVQFLGDNADAKSENVVPTQWNESENMLWQLDLPGAGSSSPVIAGEKIFVTCFSQNDSSMSRFVVCVNKNTGEEIWKKEVEVDYREDGFSGYLKEHGYASNTPVTDGESLFVFLGKGGVHAFDLDGNKLWNVEIGKQSSNRRWGSAASLLLFEDRVIVNAAEEARAIIALNKENGEQVWKQDADMLELAFGTPRLVQLGDDKVEMVISVPGEVWGMDPASGKLNWYCESPLTGNVSPSVIVEGDLIYSFGGYQSKGSLAIRAGGKDDVTKSNRVWTSRTTSYVATPLLHEGTFYWIDDRGVANASSAKNGESVYRERVGGLTGRPVYSSPTMIGEHIYVVTRRAGTIVYTPGDAFEEVSRNVIEGDETDFNASPAVSENRLYIRSDKALYCIGSE